MSESNRVVRRLKWFYSHPLLSWPITVAAILGLLAPLRQPIADLWGFFVDEPGLELVDARSVTDPWEAAGLLRETLPELADSAEWMMMGQMDPVVISLSGDHDAEPIANPQPVRLPGFSQFPELALLDVVLRNTAQQSAVVSRIDVEAERIGPSPNMILCAPAGPLVPSAAYHVLLTEDKRRQVATARIAHRIGGNDAERIGILVGQSGASGRYRLRAVLIYNRTQRLRLPPIDVDLGEGCGELRGRLHDALRFPSIKER